MAAYVLPIESHLLLARFLCVLCAPCSKELSPPRQKTSAIPHFHLRSHLQRISGSHLLLPRFPLHLRCQFYSQFRRAQ
jgi:hypothetical protein